MLVCQLYVTYLNTLMDILNAESVEHLSLERVTDTDRYNIILCVKNNRTSDSTPRLAQKRLLFRAAPILCL